MHKMTFKPLSSHRDCSKKRGSLKKLRLPLLCFEVEL